MNNSSILAKKQVLISDNSEVTLTITVVSSHIKQTYEKIILDFSKKANLKGFRKGKVPTNVIIRKFGESILSETTEKIVQNGFEEALKEKAPKPLQFKPPKVEIKDKISLDKNFGFLVTYDTYPEIELGEFQKLELVQPEPKISEEDIQKELLRIQEQNSTIVDKENSESGIQVEKGNVVTLNYIEKDSTGKNIETTERKDFVFEIGTGYNLYQFDDDLIGMSRGEVKLISKTFPSDYQYKELADRKVDIEVTVTSIKEKKLPELDDDLAQDIDENFKSLEDLKNNLKETLCKEADRIIREQLISTLLEKVLDTSKVPLPKSMLEANTENEWQQFVSRSRMSPEQFDIALAKEGQSKNDIIKEWTPNIEKRTKLTLIVEKLAETLKIKVSEEDLTLSINERASNQKTEPEEMRKQFEQNNMMDYLRSDIRNEKLYNKLLKESSIKKGKQTPYVDLLQRNS